MDESNRFFGIAYLYTVIITLFSIASYLLLFSYSAIDKYTIKAFLVEFFVLVAIWCVLYMLNRTKHLSFLTLSKDNIVRKATGGVIIINGLTSIFIYLSQVVYAVSLVISRNIDESVVPTLVYFIFILCQIFVGLFLIKRKNNDYEQNDTGVVIGTVYLYTLIMVAFSLLTNLVRIMINPTSLNKFSFLWLTCIVIMIIILYLLNKRQNQSLASVFYNDTDRKSAGILMIISGVIAISVLLNSVINIFWLLDSNLSDNKYAVSNIMLSAIKLFIIACQIGLGAYLLKKSSSKADEPNNVQ